MADGARRRTAEQVSDRVFDHGEGPFWDAVAGRLLCLDVYRGEVVAFDADARVTRRELGVSTATAIRAREGGGFVVAAGQRICAFLPDFSGPHMLLDLPVGPGVRTNDAGCDADGGLVVGTMSARRVAGVGEVFRVDADRSVSRLLGNVSIPNGIQWTSNGERAFFVDTPTRCIDKFDVAAGTGEWSRRRTHVVVEDTSGYPDGMAIDADGGLWIALWGGGAVRHYDAGGVLVEQIDVPGVTQVSSCAFGGDDLRTLYITTSREDLDETDQPRAGAIFAVRTDRPGAPLPAFAG